MWERIFKTGEKMSRIPRIVSIFCKQGAYLVGSYANYLIGKGETYKDYDLIVPPEKWTTIALLIPKYAQLNSFGGWKFTDGLGNKVDIFPMSIEEYLRQYAKDKEQAYVLDYMNNRIFTSLIVEVK